MDTMGRKQKMFRTVKTMEEVGELLREQLVGSDSFRGTDKIAQVTFDPFQQKYLVVILE